MGFFLKEYVEGRCNLLKMYGRPPCDIIVYLSCDSIDTGPLQWKMCKLFESNSSQVLDVQFGVSLRCLKMVSYYILTYTFMQEMHAKAWLSTIVSKFV